MNKAALGVLFLCAGCASHTGPSPREMQAMQEAQMEQMLQMMRSQMEGTQDIMAGRDTDAARASKKHAEAMALQGKQMEEQLRKDPNYVRAQEQGEREDREALRRNPSGVETQFNLSDAEEAELGFGMAQQFLSNQRLVADEGLQRYVNSVGVWVTQQSERPNLPWRFAVIEGDAPNAFAVPGGYVFITRGMLALAESESELAGILGHEISHVVRKHHLRWIYMNKELEVSVLRAEEQIGKTSAASRQMFQEMGKVMQSSIERMNSPETKAGMSKSEEFEADTDGAILAWRAGYEAWGLVAVIQRFEAASRDRYGTDTALTGHPEPLQRLRMLDVALRSRDEKDTLGELAAERFQRATQGVRQRSG
ncbi:MAG: M48 family metalloprotease [Prolixibacteraceae bacterium]|nr:M48 family metalloprotease [Burkholderiales bacterium]